MNRLQSITLEKNVLYWDSVLVTVPNLFASLSDSFLFSDIEPGQLFLDVNQSQIVPVFRVSSALHSSFVKTAGKSFSDSQLPRFSPIEPWFFSTVTIASAGWKIQMFCMSLRFRGAWWMVLDCAFDFVVYLHLWIGLWNSFLPKPPPDFLLLWVRQYPFFATFESINNFLGEIFQHKEAVSKNCLKKYH